MDHDTKHAFVIKYAPSQLSEVVFADDAVEQSIGRYAAGKDLRPLILYGPNGTGKSTLAQLLPIAMESAFGPSDVYNYNPINASDSKAAQRIWDNAEYRGLYGGIKIYIFEEFDLFPKKLVSTIKSVMDSAEGRILFIATTNDVTALDKGHLSRAVRLPVNQPPLDRWMPRVKAIFEAEGVRIPSKSQLAEMLEYSRGDNREFLSHLQMYVERAKSMHKDVT